jgi:hypothetical protein
MDTHRYDTRYQTNAKVRCEKYGSGMVSHMVMKNLSKAGAKLNQVASSVPFEKGDILRLIVDLEQMNSRRVVNAEVRWIKGSSLGVHFIEPQEVLSKLVNRLQNNG